MLASFQVSCLRSQQLRPRAGRVPSIIVLRLSANAILLTMALPALWQRKVLIVALYLTRSALANSPYPASPRVLGLPARVALPRAAWLQGCLAWAQRLRSAAQAASHTCLPASSCGDASRGAQPCSLTHSLPRRSSGPSSATTCQRACGPSGAAWSRSWALAGPARPSWAASCWTTPASAGPSRSLQSFKSWARWCVVCGCPHARPARCSGSNMPGLCPVAHRALTPGATQVMLPLLLLVPLREEPPGKRSGPSEPLLAGSAEALAGDAEAGITAPAGIEGGAAAPLSIPPQQEKGGQGSPCSLSRRPSQPATPDRSNSGSLPGRPGASPRRASMGRRRSLQHGTN